MKLALLMAIAVAAPAEQFDLICKGGIKYQLLDEYQPYDFRLRVDLSTGRYCQDDCAAVRPIAEVQPTFITFEKETPEEKARGISRSRIVSRESGKFLTYITERRPSIIAVEAQCEPAPFSSFPEIRTKF